MIAFGLPHEGPTFKVAAQRLSYDTFTDSQRNPGYTHPEEEAVQKQQTEGWRRKAIMGIACEIQPTVYHTSFACIAHKGLSACTALFFQGLHL